jgi:hypothetical protein
MSCLLCPPANLKFSSLYMLYITSWGLFKLMRHFSALFQFGNPDGKALSQFVLVEN